MDIGLELRRKSLQKLVDMYAGQAKLSDKINKNIDPPGKYITPSQISQILNGRTMGEKLCRKIESALSLPRYWFDMPKEDQERLTIDTEVLEIAQAINVLPPSQRTALRAALINSNADAENQ